MKKTAILIVCALLVVVLGIIGAKALLSPGDKDSAEPNSDMSNIPITSTAPDDSTATQPNAPVSSDIPAVTPTIPNGDEPVKLYDNGIAFFNYDSTKLFFDEIPPSDEDGIPMVSFMPIDAESALPRVDAMPLKVSATGDGNDNFYNINEEGWQQLAAACVLQYYSPTGQNAAQISFLDTTIKPEGATSMKMFTTINVTVPDEVATQTGDVSMNGSIRLIANGENAMVTIALSRQNASLPAELENVYMSMQLH